ncbi:ABC transporter permease [Myxococcus sp. MxC21-1]|uniref:ABC transporter permease n=1 Tax=Myxococcus sp. MxC21-1 TaxID=3041439 RepID=UPI00293192B6|nr:ABC transporter permease [Myxococcus sp. MxC21-1]WNZ61339.1 ABC transporter permease [Myxococcus sp. MxC21-1]
MRDLLRRLLRQRKAAVGGSILLGFIVLALIGPWLVMDPTELVGRPHQPPSAAHWFGTTGQGQDVLAQTVVGARETLAIGFAVGTLVTLMGALIGVTSGYLGRRVDDVLTLTTNVFLVIPGLPLAIVLGAYLPSGPFRMVVVLSLAGWAWNARVFRAEAMALRNRDFVSAAFVAGRAARASSSGSCCPTWRRCWARRSLATRSTRWARRWAWSSSAWATWAR